MSKKYGQPEYEVPDNKTERGRNMQRGQGYGMNSIFHRISVRKYEDKPVEVPKSNFTKHNIENYLKKVPQFEVGGRSASYRKLIYTMVVRRGMVYEDARDAIIKWDADGINYQEEEPTQFYHSIRNPLTR